MQRNRLPKWIQGIATSILFLAWVSLALPVMGVLLVLFAYPGWWLMMNTHILSWVNDHIFIALGFANIALAGWVASRCLIRATAFLLGQEA